MGDRNPKIFWKWREPHLVRGGNLLIVCRNYQYLFIVTSLLIVYRWPAVFISTDRSAQIDIFTWEPWRIWVPSPKKDRENVILLLQDGIELLNSIAMEDDDHMIQNPKLFSNAHSSGDWLNTKLSS